jgi:hypothetical protein
VAPVDADQDSDTLAHVVPVTARPVGVGGIWVAPPLVVVALTGADWADEPALFAALTVKEYGG